MRRLMGVLLVALAIMTAIPAAGYAQGNEGKTTLDMRATESGASVCKTTGAETQCSFSSGSKEIYLVVNYQDLPGVEITSALQDDAGGNTIFSKMDNLNGSGAKAYRVTGTDVYNEYVRLLTQHSNTLVSSLSNTSLSLYGRMQQALNVVSPALLVIRQLEKFPLDDNARSQLDTAKTHLDTAKTKITSGLYGGANSDAQNQAVQDALTAAQAANNAIQAAQSGLSGKSDLPFPDVNVAAGNYYTAKITRNRSPVQTINWAVATQQLPTQTPQATPGPTDTPGPTPNVSQATLTARAASPTPNPTATATPGPATATTAASQATGTPAPTTASAPTATPQPAAQLQTQATATVAAAAAAAAQPTQAIAQAQAQATRLPQAQAQPQATVAPAAATSALAAPAAATTAASVAQAGPTTAPTAVKVASVVDLSRLTPVADGSSRVAGQASGSSLPLAAIGLAVVALGLGGVALWMRRRV